VATEFLLDAEVYGLGTRKTSVVTQEVRERAAIAVAAELGMTYVPEGGTAHVIADAVLSTVLGDVRVATEVGDVEFEHNGDDAYFATTGGRRMLCEGSIALLEDER
jgi:hypothetical protein